MSTPTTTVPSLSVVICCYTPDRWVLLTGGIDAARRQLAGSDSLVVVVDHHKRLHADLTDRYRTDAAVEVVAGTGAQGLSHARNTGLAHARGEVIVFLDDDAVAEPGSLDAVRSALADPAVVAIGGAVTPDWAAGGPPGWFPAEFGWVVGCDYRGIAPGGAEIRNPIGAAMAVRRDALIGIGGFSPDLGRVGTFPAGCEETLMGIALRRANPGARIVRDTRFRVRHAVPAERARPGYFLRRCYQEGRSKAALAGLSSTGEALSSESSYVATVLTSGFIKHLGHPSRALALIAGFLWTAAGYASGTAHTLLHHPLRKGNMSSSIAALLRVPRTSRLAALALLLYFVAEWIVSASWRGAFEYRWTRSGELGIPFCGAHGDIACSAIWPVMNAGMILTGLAIIVLAASWRALAWVPNPATAALTVSGLGLIGAGLVTERISYPVHITLMNVFVAFGAAGCLLIGVSASTRLPGSGRTVLVVAGAIAAVAFFALTGGLTSWLGPGGTERAAIYALLIGLLVAGVRGAARIATDPPEAATEGLEVLAEAGR